MHNENMEAGNSRGITKCSIGDPHSYTLPAYEQGRSDMEA